MSFPLILNNSTYDFRAVPLAIGSLYGGVYVSFFLYATLIIYRFIMGNANQFEYILAIFPTFIAIIWFIKKFPYSSLWRKIIYSFLVYLIVRFVTLILFLSFTSNLGTMFTPRFVHMLETMIFQCIIAGVSVYILEFFRRNSMMREEIIKSEKIKIVSEIAASVAHEVRNPLTSVRGFIQLMGNQDVSMESRRYYQKICLEELDRAQQIISDYLTLAKPEPEKIEEMDIQVEIDYVCNVLLSYANYQNVQIEKHIPYYRLFVLGDRYKFHQAVINIGKNSIEAMPDGGVLKFIVQKVNNSVVISIIDTGIGMTPEQINRLGTPYYSTKDKGTGLGSMVTFSIIKKMQGKIEIKSEKGKGTTHIITLQLMQ
jgi:two-component system sporulation sensor kinase B